MKIEIKVPQMGESISEATVSEVLKASGTYVAADDEILELETDKVNQALYAPQKGVITLSVAKGDVVKIGQVVGFVDSDQVPDSKQVVAEPKKEAPKQQAPKTEEKKPVPKIIEASKTEVSQPSARVTIEESIKDLSDQKQPIPEMPKVLSQKMENRQEMGNRQKSRKKMTKIRKVIAERLVQAQKQAAMLTTFNEVDMTQIMLLRERYKETFIKEHGVKLGFMSFFVKAVVHALQAYPDVNSYIDGDEIVHHDYYDVGVAVGTDRGVMVPVIRDCDKLTFSGIELVIEDFAKKARLGGLSVDDLTGGSFTITNGGIYGSLLSTPILNPPQSAILGMHKIMKRAVVVDDQIVIRQMMYLALSYDHRMIDGKEAVSFLVMIKNLLEDPARLLLEV